MQRNQPSKIWTLSAALVATGIGLAAREATARGWEAARDEPAPSNPADRNVTWVDAVMWAGLSGIVVGISRVIAKRGVAELWASQDGQAADDWEPDGRS